MEKNTIAMNILLKLQTLYGNLWKQAKTWKDLSEIDPPEECLSTPQELAMITSYNCANEIKVILDEFLPHVSDIHKEG